MKGNCVSPFITRIAIFGMALLSMTVLAALFVLAPGAQRDTEVPVIVESPVPFVETAAVTTPTESAEVQFTLQTIGEHGKLAYIGIGGDIDGIVNPDLVVHTGSAVRIILINGDGMPHDLFIPELDTGTEYVSRVSDQTEIVFNVGAMHPGTYVYYCTFPGHRQAGQEGKFLVTAKP